MKKNSVTHLSAKKAWDLIQKEPKVAFIDVRSDMEYLFIGHPLGSVNIPWIEEPNWEVNPHCVQDVRKPVLGGVIDSPGHHSVPILLICRSGNRSDEAGKLRSKMVSNESIT